MKINTRPHFDASALTLIASVFLVATYNTTFWHTFIGATGDFSLAHVPLHAGCFLLIVLLFNRCLTLVNFRYVLKPALIALLLATSATSYFENHFGTQVDRAMVQNLFETDLREARELLWKLMLTVAVLGVLPSLAVWRMNLTFAPWRRDLVLWLSGGFRERFHIDQCCLAARAGQPFSHDNVSFGFGVGWVQQMRGAHF